MNTLTSEEKAAMIAETEKEIEAARRHGITLKRADFQVIDGALYVDGTPPRQWIEAVSGLHEEPGPDVLVGMYVFPPDRPGDSFWVDRVYVIETTRVLILTGYGSLRVEEGHKVLVEND